MGSASLDVGTATGRYLLAACELGFHAFGVDVNPIAIGHARRIVRPYGVSEDRVMLADATALPFEKDRFLLVTCMMGTIHHIEDADGAISEMTRVLTPGGRLILSVIRKKDDEMMYLAVSSDDSKAALARRVTALGVDMSAILERHGLETLEVGIAASAMATELVQLGNLNIITCGGRLLILEELIREVFPGAPSELLVISATKRL